MTTKILGGVQQIMKRVENPILEIGKDQELQNYKEITEFKGLKNHIEEDRLSHTLLGTPRPDTECLRYRVTDRLSLLECLVIPLMLRDLRGPHRQDSYNQLTCLLTEDWQEGKLLEKTKAVIWKIPWQRLIILWRKGIPIE